MVYEEDPGSRLPAESGALELSQCCCVSLKGRRKGEHTWGKKSRIGCRCVNLEMPVTTRAGLGPPGRLGAACGASIQSQGSRVECMHGCFMPGSMCFRVCPFCKTASLAPSKMEKAWVRM